MELSTSSLPHGERCLSVRAGISSDTQTTCLPPKSGASLPFGCYFRMIFWLHATALAPAQLLHPTLRSTEIYSSTALGPEGQQHQINPGGTQPPSTPLTPCLLPTHYPSHFHMMGRESHALCLLQGMIYADGQKPASVETRTA